MMWALPRLFGLLVDAFLGQGVYALGSSRPPDRSPPWGGAAGGASSRGQNPPGPPAAERSGPVDAGAASSGGSTVSSPSLPAWEPASHSDPAAAARTAPLDLDKDLAGEAIKLVRYAIVSVHRCEEKVLPAGSGEVLVTDSMSGENFATWMVARYLQSEAYQAAVARDRRNRLSHADKKYLRVAYEVLERWPRESRDCCDDTKVQVLAGIRDALRGLAQRPARTVAATHTLAPPPPPAAPPTAESTAERVKPSAEETAVLQAIVGRGGTAATSELVRRTGLPQSQVRKAIKGLEAAGRIRRTGEGLQTRYHAVEQSPPKPPRRRRR